MKTMFVIPDVYHLIASFIMYSMLGWFVESLYMSICNKKFTNRGFVFLPFCPIYGFGATFGCIILSPLTKNIILLYFVSAVLATIFEFLVAKLMLSIFGDFWWDYNEKQLNYKGIVCLESTLAWGLYGILVVKFLNIRIFHLINLVDKPVGIILMRFVFGVVTIDFVYHFLVALGINLEKRTNNIKEKYRNFKFRW